MSFEHDELIRMKRKCYLLYIIVPVLAVGLLQMVFLIYSIISGSFVIFDTYFSFAMILSTITIIMIVRFIVMRIRKKALKSPMYFFPLLIFSMFFWAFSLGFNTYSSFALFLSTVSIIVIVRFIVMRTQKKAVKSPIIFIPVLIFSIFFAFLYMEVSRDYFIYKATIKPQGKRISIHRIRKCEFDPAGGEDHFCKNILVFVNWKNVIFPLRIISFQPQGKSMSIKDGLIYFHQEGCCDSPDLITVIDGRGRIIKTCDLKPRLSVYGKPVTRKEWQIVYNCPQRKCTKEGYCGKEYGNRDRKLRGQ